MTSLPNFHFLLLLLLVYKNIIKCSLLTLYLTNLLNSLIRGFFFFFLEKRVDFIIKMIKYQMLIIKVP